MLPAIPYKLDYWAFQTAALLITAFLIPGLTVSGPFSALITVVALSLVNTYLWDASLFLAIPQDLSVHAITLLLANGVLFWIIVKVLPGIAIRGVLPALAAPVVFTITSIAIQHYGPRIDWSQVLVQLQALFSQLKGGFTSVQPQQHSLHQIIDLMHTAV